MIRADGHPPAHVLAELADGLLDRPQDAQIRAHVDSCESCQAVLGQLDQVTQLLQSAPSDLPVPSDVAARIDRALATEAAADSASSAQVTHMNDRPVAWFRRKVPQALAAAAAAAVVGLVGYSLIGDGSPVDFASGGGDDAATDTDEASVAEDSGPAEEGPAGAEAQREQLESEDMAEQDAADGAELFSDAAAVEAMVETWREGTEVEPGCGEALAGELDMPLVGTAQLGDEILVTLHDDDTLVGWTISSCSDTDVSGGPHTAPTPTD